MMLFTLLKNYGQTIDFQLKSGNLIQLTLENKGNGKYLISKFIKSSNNIFKTDDFWNFSKVDLKSNKIGLDPNKNYWFIDVENFANSINLGRTKSTVTVDCFCKTAGNGDGCAVTTPDLDGQVTCYNAGSCCCTMRLIVGEKIYEGGFVLLEADEIIFN